MAKKKFTIRLSLVFIMTIMILATAITILSVSAGLYRNSINWVIEALSQKVSDHIIDKLVSNEVSSKPIEYTKQVINKIEISENGKIFILDAKYLILASAERKEGKLQPDRYSRGRIKISNIRDPLVSRSFQKFLKNEKKKERKLFKRKFDHFPFWYNWRKYISIYKPFRLKTGQTWFVAIVFPFRDFFGSITRNNIILYSIAAFFVFLAIIIGLNISKRISEPLSALSIETEKIRNFELESREHIGSFLEEVERMSDSVDNMRNGLRSFKKYVPSDLVKELIKMGKEATLGGEKKSLTVFFSDIAGFTTISEKLEPEQLVEFLGEYLGEMTKIIHDHKGTVDKFIGDAVMAFWGAPIDFSDHAFMACKAALRYREKLSKLGKIWKSQGKPDFYSRIGINTGEIIVGNMGFEDRMNYTVIGDPVNLASRIEGLNKSYGTTIMIGEETYRIVKDEMETRFLDIVAVKGKKKGVRLYELMAEKGQITSARIENRKYYEEGLSFYLDRQFENAKASFQKALRIYLEDLGSEVFIKRCDEFLKNPPDEKWNGVYIATSK